MAQTETERLAFLAKAIRAVEYYRRQGRLTDPGAVVGLLADYAAGMTDWRLDGDQEEEVLVILVEDWQEEAN